MGAPTEFQWAFTAAENCFTHIRAFRERRAIARARLRTRLTRRRQAIYRSPKILATVHDD